MIKFPVWFLVLFLFFTGPFSKADTAALQCRQVFSALDGTWRSSGGSVFMDVRENVFFYWDYVKSLPKMFIERDLLTEGILPGDYHSLNVADIPMNGERQLLLVDLDDAGKGPFLFDFIRFVTTVNAQGIDVSAKKLFEMYQEGLLGKKNDLPDFLKDILRTSQKDEETAAKKNLEKFVEDDRFKHSEKTRLIPISKTSAEVQAVFAQDQAVFKKELGDWQILDQAFRIKTTGGSANQPRFWYLVERRGQKIIIEFKTNPGTALSAYQKQEDFLSRIQKIQNIYWPKEKDPLFKAFVSGTRNYFMRPRHKSFVDFEEIDSKKQMKQAEEYVLYLAYDSGLRVAQQKPNLYIEAIARDFKGALAVVKQQVADYMEIVRKMRGD